MSEEKTALETGVAIHTALLNGVSVSFDGGKTFEEVGTITPELWELIEPIQKNSASPNRQIQVYAAAEMRGTFYLKPKKPRKVRQTPAFWSAYR